MWFLASAENSLFVLGGLLCSQNNKAGCKLTVASRPWETSAYKKQKPPQSCERAMLTGSDLLYYRTEPIFIKWHNKRCSEETDIMAQSAARCHWWSVSNKTNSWRSYRSDIACWSTAKPWRLETNLTAFHFILHHQEKQWLNFNFMLKFWNFSPPKASVKWLKC